MLVSKDDSELPPCVVSNAAANLAPPAAPTPNIVLLKPVYRFLLAQARDLVNAQQYQSAIILAHAACELVTEETMNNLLRRWAEFSREAVMLDVKRGATLNDPKVLDLYGAMTEDYPAGRPDRGVAPAAWWPVWKASLELRREVAHNGLQVTKAQARGGVESCRHYIDHMAATQERSPP